ncbi:MAG: hypothetical protein U0Z53_07175 [Blastocatellia bacterium]
MSAILQLVNQLPDRSTVPQSEEEQFGNLMSSEVSPEQKLACALTWILQLQNDLESVRSRLAQAERDLMLKDALLRNAVVRERELRRQITPPCASQLTGLTGV